MKNFVVIFFTFSLVFSLAQNETMLDFDGTWQVRTDYRKKSDFEAIKPQIIEEVHQMLSQSEDFRYTNVRKNITVNGFNVTLMSKEEVENGLRWPIVEYNTK